MNSRFHAILKAPMGDEFQHAAVMSACDVPRLIAEVHRLALRYADLVAACRAGLLDAAENGDNPQSSDAWRFVLDELPPLPETHPLAQRWREAHVDGWGDA
ncbi:hypothetical protein ACXJJ3_12865 [Kribbella sp. WER1]